MKITAKKLRQLIREEVESLESELADLEAQEMAISNEYEALEAEVFR